jgi:hypothetical protein
MDHPDFRVSGEIFYYVRASGEGVGDGEAYSGAAALFFEGGAGGFCAGERRMGTTSVNLKSAKKASFLKALNTAWRNTAPKRLAAEFPQEI